MAKTWDETEQAFRALLASERGPELHADTVRNAWDFIAFARAVSGPVDVGFGYWPTVQFDWAGVPFHGEVEVFEDSLELYLHDDGPINVRTYQHTAGAPLPADFVTDYLKQRNG